jgi:hypothetical protein
MPFLLWLTSQINFGKKISAIVKKNSTVSIGTLHKKINSFFEFNQETVFSLG